MKRQAILCPRLSVGIDSRRVIVGSSGDQTRTHRSRYWRHVGPAGAVLSDLSTGAAFQVPLTDVIA
jgi:hypothetical protein